MCKFLIITNTIYVFLLVNYFGYKKYHNIRCEIFSRMLKINYNYINYFQSDPTIKDINCCTHCINYLLICLLVLIFILHSS